MARLFPDHVPEPIRTNPSRAAECIIYDALSETLPDDYAVFGWVAWVVRRPGQGARDGEADFVIAHPEWGVLVLEVKGGAVELDARTGTWTSTSLAGHVNILRESPMSQAMRHRHDLERKLAESRAWGGRHPTFGWAVAFPDCLAPPGDLGPDAPRELLICRDDLGRLDQRIADIGRFWGGREIGRDPLGHDGLEVVCQLLAHSFQLRMPLGRRVDEDTGRILELSQEQFSVLDGLSRNRRVLISGSAGTGKTLLALDKARRLARDEGFRTLLTCFNRPLAEFLHASAGDIPGLTVLNFHELCIRWARQAGLAVDVPGEELARNDFYRRGLPTALADALARLPDRFDAIVLDEGQDFSATDRTALEMTLVDSATSVLYVFQDETQLIYRDGAPWPADGMARFELTRNFRNTRAIHAALARLAGDTRTRALGPAGDPVELIPARDGTQQSRELSRALHRLIREQGVAPGQIAVLVSSRSGAPPLLVDGRIGVFEATTEHATADGRVLFESITRFKGLERDVVILTRLEPVEFVEFEPMLYVGASRARSKLIVIADEAALRRFGSPGSDAG